MPAQLAHLYIARSKKVLLVKNEICLAPAIFKSIMKKSFLLTIILCASVALTYGQIPMPAFGTMDSIDINNVNALSMVHGDMWYNPNIGQARCESPKGSGKTFAYAGALWIAAYDLSNNLHIAGQTYRGDGDDYWPGPLDANHTLSYATSQKWAKIWKVYQTDIDTFLTQSSHTISNTAPSILHWPGKGNTYATGDSGVALTVTTPMAPFVDVNHNGIYEPLSGDYPAIKGDEALWNVYSDNGPLHDRTNGAALKFEIHLMTYAYHRNTLIDNVVYYEYSIINKSALDYHACRIGFWADLDLGYSSDDYTGFDSSHHMGINYNAVSPDGSGQAYAYDTMIPMSAVTVIRMPGDGNASHLQPAGGFIYFNNESSATGDPSSLTSFTNYLHNTWIDGVHLADDFAGPGVASNGRGSGPLVDYAYTGDPSDSNQWSECASHNNSGDRRFLVTTPDFDLAAGAGTTYVVALLVSNPQLNNVCPTANFDAIKTVADTAWANYYANWDSTLSTPNIITNNYDIKVFPNPATNCINILSSLSGTAELYNMLGQKLITQSLYNTHSQIDISHLSTGIYLLQLKDTMGNSIYQTKIVKQ